MTNKVKLGHIDVVAFDRENEAWGIFSNYAATPIEMKTPFGDRTFPTVEHYFQYMKDPDNKHYLNNILSSSDPQHARDVGAKHFQTLLNRAKQDEDFNAELHAKALQNAWHRGGADAAMDEAITAKIEQHPHVAIELMKTENACLVEDTGSRSPGNQDGNWGWKTGGKIDAHQGAGNKLGILLMEKRNELYLQHNQASLVVKNPRQLSEDAREIMQKNHSQDNLINLAKHQTALHKNQDNRKNVYAPYSSKHTSVKGPPLNKWQPRFSQLEASKEINKAVFKGGEIPVVCKGAQKGTLKIAFDNPRDAEAFMKTLSGLNVSYHGGNDRFPMEYGGKELRHIVRFENKSGQKTQIPPDALKFLNDKVGKKEAAALIESMGFKNPAPTKVNALKKMV